jgi:hypothetical protein
MTWTYDPAQIASSPLMQMRVLIGDTLTKDPQLQDEELAFFQTQKTNIYGACALACRSLAARLSREADSTQGNLHTLYSSRARAYAQRAAQFEVDETVRSAGVPFSGQTSQADYDARAADLDRMGPEFEIGGDENRNITPLRRR